MEINDKVDFSDTMNLPKKTILTNDDIAKKEKFFLERMQEVRRYREVLNKNKNSNTVYNISESPMKIQDKLDITYVQNKILKDIVIRYRLQRGDIVNHELDFMYLPKNESLSGEKKLEVEEIVKNRSLTKRKLTEITRNQIQKMKNLGLAVNYSSLSSSTLEKNFSSIVIQKFYEMYKNKEVYEKAKLVNWCPKCEKSVNNEEICKEDEKSNIFFLTFKIEDDKGVFKNLSTFQDTYLVASTINPWVLDCDSKIAVASDIEYSVVEVKQKDKIIRYIIASDYVEYIMEQAFIIRFDVRRKIQGKDLVGMKCYNVIDNTPVLNVISIGRKDVVIDSKISSGISIISPGNTYLDYLVLKDNPELSVKDCLDKNGKLINFSHNFANIEYKEANDKVIEMVKKSNMYLCEDLINVKAMKCPECKEDLIYHGEKSWYLKSQIDDDKKNEIFNDVTSKVANNGKFDKDDLKNQLLKNIKGNELCISTENKYGIPVPVFYCGECSSLVINDSVISLLKEMFQKEGMSEWYRKTPDEIIQGKVSCDKCGCTFLFKGTSCLNNKFEEICVSTWNNVSTNREKEDICIESYKEFLNLIQKSFYDKSLLDRLKGAKNILIHPNLRYYQLKNQNKNIQEVPNQMEEKIIYDGIENKVEFFDTDYIVKQYGTDVLRIFFIQNSYQKKHGVKKSDIIQANVAYKKIRSTLKFIISNLYDFNPAKHYVDIENRDDLDVYMYSNLVSLSNSAREDYDKLQLYQAFSKILEYCTNTLQKNYFNVIKYRLYVLNADDIKRKSTQTTLYDIYIILLELLGAVIPFTFEETWSYIWHNDNSEASNFLLYRSNIKQIDINNYSSAINKWKNIYFIINKVNIQIKKAINSGKIKKSLQAKVILGVNDKTKEFIDKNHEDFLRALNVSVLKTEVSTKSYIKVEVAEGVECKRCKNYSVDIGKDIKYRYLCPECAKIMDKNIKN